MLSPPDQCNIADKAGNIASARALTASRPYAHPHQVAHSRLVAHARWVVRRLVRAPTCIVRALVPERVGAVGLAAPSEAMMRNELSRPGAGAEARAWRGARAT